MVTSNSGKKVWWQCSNGHEWETSINQRNRGRGCPICAKQNQGKKRSENWIASKGSLYDHNRELASEWHPTKNGELTPKDVACNTVKKVWWKCSNGHEWEASINNRFRGRNCPYCSNKKVLVGFNDLKSQFPELMKEWNYEKNSIKPDEVSYGSDHNVWWRCEKGHEWQTNIYFRTNNHYGCPICAKETQTSFPEQTIFYYCNRLFSKVHNRHIVSGYEIDVFIEDINAGIEYDGYFYHSSKEALKLEQHKNCIINNAGVLLYRIKETTNDTQIEFENNTFYLPRKYDDTMLKKVLEKLFSILGVCVKNDFIDITRDRTEILNNYISNKKEKSIVKLYPEIAKEWNYERNGKLTPEMFTGTSHKKVWWRCSKGHEWESIISNRTDKKRGCPYCANQKVLPGVNDLATRNPTLANEWHPTKNGTLRPSQVFPGSNKKVWWKCAEGHEWQAVIYSRNNGNGCPYCSGKKILAGFNDIATTDPELAKEWHPTKNSTLTPRDLTRGSGKSVWWICSHGHEWKRSPNGRTSKGGNGCPICAHEK